MNALACYVYRLINAKPTDNMNLSEVEHRALAELQSLPCRNTDELAEWLTQDHMPQENWLVPPPIVSD